MNDEIRLGDEVEDLVTGYKGIAVARTKFLNGCVQIAVSARLQKGQTEYPKEAFVSIDTQSLKVITKNKIPCDENRPKEEKETKSTGGFPTRLSRMRGF